MSIKEYFNMTDPAYSEWEIYHHFKYTTTWKLTVLYVRILELIRTIYPNTYKQYMIDMVNKFEK